MQTSAPRANRIPRITPTRPSLYRRLHRWLSVRHLKARIDRIAVQRYHLQHWMAMDQASILAHRLHYTKSPVLQARVANDGVELRRMTDLLARLRAELAEVEGAL